MAIVRPQTVRRSNVFNQWLDSLTDDVARRAITIRTVRIEAGLFGDVKSLGGGVSEIRVDVGQGYRVYFHRQGLTVTLLLCGGDKSTQDEDIKAAKKMVANLKPPKPKTGRKGAPKRGK